MSTMAAGLVNMEISVVMARWVQSSQSRAAWRCVRWRCAAPRSRSGGCLHLWPAAMSMARLH